MIETTGKEIISNKKILLVKKMTFNQIYLNQFPENEGYGSFQLGMDWLKAMKRRTRKNEQ